MNLLKMFFFFPPNPPGLNYYALVPILMPTFSSCFLQDPRIWPILVSKCKSQFQDFCIFMECINNSRLLVEGLHEYYLICSFRVLHSTSLSLPLSHPYPSAEPHISSYCLMPSSSPCTQTICDLIFYPNHFQDIFFPKEIQFPS